MIQQLQQKMHAEIPLSKQIGIRIEEYSELSLTLSAPLENNINHKNTAFGGSLYCVSVLSGWGLIYRVLKRHGLSGHIVIHESHTKFLRPVDSTITARSAFESGHQCERFLDRYGRKGIARVKLESRIACHNEVCVKFEGSYVVHR